MENMNGIFTNPTVALYDRWEDCLGNMYEILIIFLVTLVA